MSGFGIMVGVKVGIRFQDEGRNMLLRSGRVSGQDSMSGSGFGIRVGVRIQDGRQC